MPIAGEAERRRRPAPPPGRERRRTNAAPWPSRARPAPVRWHRSGCSRAACRSRSRAARNWRTRPATAARSAITTRQKAIDHAAAAHHPRFAEIAQQPRHLTEHRARRRRRSRRSPCRRSRRSSRLRCAAWSRCRERRRYMNIASRNTAPKQNSPAGCGRWRGSSARDSKGRSCRRVSCISTKAGIANASAMQPRTPVTKNTPRQPTDRRSRRRRSRRADCRS